MEVHRIPVPQTIMVRIFTLGTQGYNPVKVARNGTIGDLKRAIESQLRAPRERQRLFLLGSELTDDAASMSAANIGEDTPIQMAFTTVEQTVFANYGAITGAWVSPSYASLDQRVLPGDQVDRLLETYWLAKWVKIFALIDLLFLIVWAFYSVGFIAGAAAAFAGYVGCVRFNVPLVTVYLMWELAAIALRVYWAVIYDDLAFRIITGFAVAVEVFIAYLIVRLVIRLSQLSESDRQELMCGSLVTWVPMFREPVVVRIPARVEERVRPTSDTSPAV